MYGDDTESLDILRLTKYNDTVNMGKFMLKPQALPPTSAGGRCHSLQVFFHIQEWKGANNLNSSE